MKIILTANTSFAIFNFRKGLILELLQRGHTVIVLAPRDWTTDELMRMGCSYMPIKMSRTGKNVLSEISTLVGIFRSIKYSQPELVLSFTIKNNIYVGLCCRRLHISYAPNITGLGAGFGGKTLLQTILVKALTFSLAKASRVFVQNDSDEQFLVRERIAKRAQITLLPGSGVDLDHFSHQPLPDRKDGLQFAFIGRLMKEKGIIEFIEASKILHAAHESTRFVIVGGVDTAHGAELVERKLEEIKSLNYISVVGIQKDVRSILMQSHSVVLPSYYREGTPRSLIEAAAMGRIVITTNLPGCRDVVDDQRSGFLIESKSTASLVRAMKMTMRLSDLELKSMSKRARDKAFYTFDERIVISKYVSLLDSLKS